MVPLWKAALLELGLPPTARGFAQLQVAAYAQVLCEAVGGGEAEPEPEAELDTLLLSPPSPSLSQTDDDLVELSFAALSAVPNFIRRFDPQVQPHGTAAASAAVVQKLAADD